MYLGKEIGIITWVQAVVGVVLMATNVVLVRAIGMPVPFIVMLQCLIAWTILMILFPDENAFKLKDPSHYGYFIVAGICNAISGVLLYNAVMLTSVGAVMAAFFCFPMFKTLEHIRNPRFLELIILAIGGLVLWLIIPEYSLENVDTQGILLALSAAAFVVLQRALIEPRAPQYDHETIMRYQWGVSALILIPYCLLFEFTASWMDLALVALLGSVFTFGALSLFIGAMMVLFLPYLTTLFSAQPLIALFAAALFLGEPITWSLFAATSIATLLNVFIMIATYWKSGTMTQPETLAERVKKRMDQVNDIGQPFHDRYEKPSS